MRQVQALYRNPMTLFVALALAMLLQACGGMAQAPTLDTFNKKALVAQQTATAVVSTTRTLLATNAITPGDAENVLKATDAATEGIKVSRSLAMVDLQTAEGRIVAVLTSLNALQTYLATKGTK